MSQSWTPLWSSIVDSSIWDEDDAVCKVFITMLAIKGSDHIVRANAYQIGKKANKTEPEVLRCLEILSSPDTKRVEPQPFDGRRIEKVEGGWLILNGQKYQDLIADLIRQRQKAQWQREQRMIERSIETGEKINPAILTPQLRVRYERAKEKGKKKVMKAVDDAGEIAGRTEGVHQSLDTAHDKIARENDVADSQCGAPPAPRERCHVGGDGVCRWEKCPLLTAPDGTPCPLE